MIVIDSKPVDYEWDGRDPDVNLKCDVYIGTIKRRSDDTAVMERPEGEKLVRGLKDAKD